MIETAQGWRKRLGFHCIRPVAIEEGPEWRIPRSKSKKKRRQNQLAPAEQEEEVEAKGYFSPVDKYSKVLYEYCTRYGTIPFLHPSCKDIQV